MLELFMTGTICAHYPLLALCMTDQFQKARIKTLVFPFDALILVLIPACDRSQEGFFYSVCLGALSGINGRRISKRAY